MLPHVTAQQGHQRQGRVLVGGLLDGQTALPVGGQPGPAGAELSQGCLPHGGLQPRQTAEGPEDGPLQRRFGGGGRQGVEGAEVQAVVVYAPGVVPDALLHQHAQYHIGHRKVYRGYHNAAGGRDFLGHR